MTPLPTLHPNLHVFKGHDLSRTEIEAVCSISHVLEGHGRWVGGKHVMIDLPSRGAFPITIVWTSRPLFLVRLNTWHEDQLDEFVLEADTEEEAKEQVSHLDLGDIFPVEARLEHDDMRIFEMFVIPTAQKFHEHSMKPEVIMATSSTDARRRAKELHPDSASFHVFLQESWFPTQHLKDQVDHVPNDEFVRVMNEVNERYSNAFKELATS